MKLKKVVSIVGARPQFVKAAVVSRAFLNAQACEEVIVHTGQHYDAQMSDIFFDQLSIPKPKYNLSIGSHAHGKQTGLMLEGIENVLVNESPQWVLVYGDTNSTLAGALAASKLHIPVAHVEAGLRSFNRRMPEEINRVVTDHLSTLLFVPTEQARKNLDQEGIRGSHVMNVGDVMLDCVRTFAPLAKERSQVLKDFNLKSRGFVLCTIHRAESTDEPDSLNAIFNALAEIAKSITILLPAHPRTRKKVEAAGISLPNNLIWTEPLSYFDMICAESEARIIVTDSGGVQKEAYFNQVPCVTVRQETEWVELVETGWNFLAGNRQTKKIVEAFHHAMEAASRPQQDLYGDGRASEKIVKAIQEFNAG